jgi:hypothetical protein
VICVRPARAQLVGGNQFDRELGDCVCSICELIDRRCAGDRRLCTLSGAQVDFV